MSLTRRDVLVGTAGGAVGLLGGLAGWRVAMAGALPSTASASVKPDPGTARLVVVLLRGGLDSLDAFPRPGDPEWRALGRRDPGGTALADGFALHPALAPLAPWWAEGSLALVPAAGQPAATRSHFDAQDLLEEGGARLGAVRDGWLHRALAAAGHQGAATAIGAGLPLLLRDARGQGASSVDPSRSGKVDEALAEELARLWAGDPLLEAALRESQRAHAAAGAAGRPAMDDDSRGGGLAAEAVGAGRLLAEGGGYRFAVLDNTGWDTHSRQAPRLESQLDDLAAALLGLRAGVGEAWTRTVVVVATEFGRTARPNGTEGTDHGTASALLVAGGPVRGGRVVGDWPGLRTLFEDRDLRVATDVRAVFKGLLRDHLGVDPALLSTTVFPGSEGTPPVDGLLG